jgi:hypothetical protein
MILIRSFSAGNPCIGLDVKTGSNRLAAKDASERAARYGNWEDVQVNFNDGSRPMRGSELRAWVARHYPEFVAREA